MSVLVTVHPPGPHRRARVVIETDNEAESLGPKVAAKLGRQLIEAAKEAQMRDDGWVPS